MRAALALAVLLLSGCGGPAPVTSTGPPDHGDLAKQLYVGLDAPSSGPAGYRVDFTLQARNADGSESYAWFGNATFHLTVTDSYSNNGVVKCKAGQGFDATRKVALADFHNDLGAGEHWSLPIPIADGRLGDGHYTVTVTAQRHAGAPLVASAEFTHCATS